MAEVNRVIDEVIGLEIHPLKSAQAATFEGDPFSVMDVTQQGLTAGGIVDREFMLIRRVADHWWPVTQQLAPQLAKTQVDIGEGGVRFSVPRFEPYDISAEPVEGSIYSVTTRGDPLEVIDQGPAAAQFFVRALGLEALSSQILFVRALPGETRCLAEWLPSKKATNKLVGAEYAPITLVGEASIRRLAGLNGQPGLPINRLRANVVSSGRALDLWAREQGMNDFRLGEDYVRLMRMGSLIVEAAGLVRRYCEHPNTDQQTGERDDLATRILAGRQGYDPYCRYGTFMGLGLNPLLAEERVRVRLGDPIEVLEFRSLDDPLVDLAEHALSLLH